MKKTANLSHPSPTHESRATPPSLPRSPSRLRLVVTANPAPPPPPIVAPPAPDPVDAEDVPTAPAVQPAGSEPEPDDAERNAPPPAPTPTPAPAPVALVPPVLPVAAEAPAPGPTVLPDVSPLPTEANGSFDRRKKRKTEDGDGSKTCSCKKSRCLKLYCACYASGSHCNELCGCEACLNKPIQGTPRSAPAPVFLLKFAQASEAGQDSAEQPTMSPMDMFRRKCTCKKSGCLKKYCDCYQGRAGCSINCKCEDCKNPFGRKVGVILDGKSSLVAPPTLNEGNGIKVDSSDDEDYYMNRALSPIPPSPVSRESSFQQDTLVGVEVQTMNGHLYPKPLSQARPESSSWQLTRRPGEEARVEHWHFSRRPAEDGTSDAMEGHHSDPKFQRNSKKLETHADRFSIPRCIEVMNAMTDLSPIEKSVAADVFLDTSNREIFLTLSVDVRTLWLKRKMESLS